MRTNPYQILEGLAIAAHAIGAERCYIGIKEAFTEEIRAISLALEEMREADALGGRPLDLVLGPDLYLFGEETGLEEVIEGRCHSHGSLGPSCSGSSPHRRRTTRPLSTTSRR